MNPEQILRQAEAALQRGATPEQVNARLREMDAPFNNLSDLRATVETGAEVPSEGGGPGGGILDVRPDEAGTARTSTATGGVQRQDIARQRLEQARAALDRGASREAVNSRIRSKSNGQIADVDQLERVATGNERGAFAGIERAPRIAAEVGTFGFIDELGGLLAGLGAAAVPGGQGFEEARQEEVRASRERLRRAREGAGIGTKAVGNLAGLLGPGGGIGLLTRGARGAARGIPLLRGALGGAAETAAFQAGTADPDPSLPFSERVEQRAENVDPLTVGGGAAAGGILGGAVAGRAASKAKPKAGARLARRARERSGLEGRVSGVRRSVRETKDEIQEELFRPLEQLGEIEDNALGRTLRENEDIAEVVKDQFPNVAEGQPPTFRQLQTVRSRIEGLKSKALRQGDSFNVNKWTQAKRELTEQIEESVEGFEEAQRAWARESARLRALEEGNKVFTKEADKVEEAFNALDTEAERRAFREGLATKYVAKLEKLSEPKAALRRIENSPQLRDKLRIIFGDEETLEQFAQDAFVEQRIRDRGQLFERVLRWAPIIGASAAGGQEAGRALGILGGG